MSRTRTLGVVVVLILAMTQTSCMVESEHPLIEPEKAKLDERLFGQWKTVVDDRTMHHFIGKPVEIANCPAGLIVRHGATFSAQHEIAWDAQPLYGFAAKIGKDDYFHLIGFQDDGDIWKLTDWKQADIKSYLLIKYAVADGRLTYWPMNLETTAKAVDCGKLKGVVTRGKKRVMLKESTENLRRFLENGGNTTLFNDKEKTVLTRVKW